MTKRGKPGVAVFGLGKIGAVMAGLFAEAGFCVSGYDPSDCARRAVEEAQPTNYETGLADLLSQNQSLINVFADPNDALEGAATAIIIVPTPSTEDGTFSAELVLDAITSICLWLATNSKKLMIVLSSTVSPGCFEQELRPRIVEILGDSYRDRLDFIYSPQFIAIGSVVADMSRPNLVLVGAEDDASAKKYLKFVGEIIRSEHSTHRMSISSAEIAKLGINTFVTTKISFANMLSELAGEVSKADIDDVLDCVGSDPRIGSRYLRSGLGYGGPCFPRDNQALAASARARGVTADIALAADQVNQRQPGRIADFIKSNTLVGDVVVFLGIAYKLETGSTIESQALQVAQAIKLSGRRVLVIDNLVEDSTVGKTLGLDFVRSLNMLPKRVDLIVVNQPTEIPPDFHRSGVTFLDLWGGTAVSGSRVVRLGRNSDVN